MKKTLITLLTAFLAVACVTEQQQTAPQFLHVQGMDIVKPDGSKFFIRGTNLGNWLNPEGYMLLFSNANSGSRIDRAFCEMVGPDFTRNFWQQFKDNYVTHEDIAYLASTGINSLRLPFHYKLFTTEDYMGNPSPEGEGFERIDSLISWCKAEGLYLILDMHDAPGGQTGDNIDDSHGYPWLLESAESQQLFIDIWTKIAARYANEPTILGYDLMNEPIAPYFENMDSLNNCLEPLYKRTVEAIRTVDANHIVLIGGAQWNGNFSMFKDYTFDNNMMYTCHRYGGEPTTEAISNIIAFRDSVKLPMYMGETGENSDEWLEQFRITLEYNNIGWHFWPYKKMQNTRCFVRFDVPEGWATIQKFADAPRTTYADIRALRPNQDSTKMALTQLIESIKFKNCDINAGYVNALCNNKK